jgi:hypothetical protein
VCLFLSVCDDFFSCVMLCMYLCVVFLFALQNVFLRILFHRNQSCFKTTTHSLPLSAAVTDLYQVKFKTQLCMCKNFI